MYRLTDVVMCNLCAIPLWIKKREWNPHIYEDVFETNRDIYVNSYGKFRIVKDYYIKQEDEIYVKGARIVTCQCIRCGKVTRVWKLKSESEDQM